MRNILRSLSETPKDGSFFIVSDGNHFYGAKYSIEDSEYCVLSEGIYFCFQSFEKTPIGWLKFIGWYHVDDLAALR